MAVFDGREGSASLLSRKILDLVVMDDLEVLGQLRKKDLCFPNRKVILLTEVPRTSLSLVDARISNEHYQLEIQAV